MNANRFIGLLAALVLLALFGPAWGHDWYDGDCCSGQDCRPVVKGEVTRTSTGWRVNPAGTSQVTIFNDGDARIRASHDVNMHICVGASTHRVFCLYKPEPGT